MHTKLDAVVSVICEVGRGDMLQMHEYNAAVNEEQGLYTEPASVQSTADLLVFLVLIILLFLFIIILLVFSYVSDDIGATGVTMT